MHENENDDDKHTNLLLAFCFVIGVVVVLACELCMGVCECVERGRDV